MKGREYLKEYKHDPRGKKRTGQTAARLDTPNQNTHRDGKHRRQYASKSQNHIPTHSQKWIGLRQDREELPFLSFAQSFQHGVNSRRLRRLRVICGDKNLAKKQEILLPDSEQRPFVLGIDLAVRTDRQRGVRGAQRQVEEEVLLKCPTLPDGVDVAIFAVGVHHTLLIDYRGVN